MPSSTFILMAGGTSVLMEQRGESDKFFPNQWLYPADKLEPGEHHEDAFHRGILEELGVKPIEFLRIPTRGGSPYYYARPGEFSHELNPYLVLYWRGSLPRAVLDTGAPLRWVTLQEALESPVEWIRQVTSSLCRMLPVSKLTPEVRRVCYLT